jgi:hypothetical protein
MATGEGLGTFTLFAKEGHHALSEDSTTDDIICCCSGFPDGVQ